MKSKWLLYFGLLFLTVGVVLKVSTDLHPIPLVLILTGVAFKVLYILSKAIRKEYKPGWELLFLFTGLVLFLSGVFLQKGEIIENASFLKIPGISLKAMFVILFIRKSRKTS